MLDAAIAKRHVVGLMNTGRFSTTYLDTVVFHSTSERHVHRLIDAAPATLRAREKQLSTNYFYLAGALPTNQDWFALHFNDV